VPERTYVSNRAGAILSDKRRVSAAAITFGFDVVDRSSVSSSSLVSVGYDPERRELEIQFVSGSIYRYFGVLPFAYEALMHAASKGRHFNEKIRDRYRFLRLV
jgi:hypothetical protein